MTWLFIGSCGFLLLAFASYAIPAAKAIPLESRLPNRHRLTMKQQTSQKQPSKTPSSAPWWSRLSARLRSYLKKQTNRGPAQKKTGVNILKDPFKAKGNLDLLKLVGNFFKFVTSKNYLTGSPTKAANQRRLENAVQALVRNPITRGEYGSNKIGRAHV